MSDAPVLLPVPSRTLAIPEGFSFRPVDSVKTGQPSALAGAAAAVSNFVSRDRVAVAAATNGQTPLAAVAPSAAAVPSLGVLDRFVGTFAGSGFNMIFRPRSDFVGGIKKAGESAGIRDNLLEINVTSETLTFLGRDVLSEVPNRGFDNQGDVILRGIPYTQSISDRLNKANGKADLFGKAAPGIHFEQGLFMKIPATNNPNTPPTISRMGSIPHGTTINAQGLDPAAPKKSPPSIPSINISPFNRGTDPTLAANLIGMNVFVQMDLSNTSDAVKGLRLPENMGDFTAAKTLDQASLMNPNLILQAINAKKNITDHYELTVSTNNKSFPGGGVANIGFLNTGDKLNGNSQSAKGNANAISVTCTYWVSTVQHTLTIPAGDFAKNPHDLEILPDDAANGTLVPKFKVELRKKVSAPTKVAVSSTQIQYSQNVLLDFGSLSWPHVSVATLVPADPLLLEADSPLLVNLK